MRGKVVGALCAAACVATALGGGVARAAAGCPWMSKSLQPAQRAARLLAAMTPTEKFALLTGVDPHGALGVADGPLYVGYIPGNPALCIPALTFNDGPAGVSDLQLGTTAFPSPIAQAATWDESLQRRFGKALGLEAWQKGVDVLLAPDVNIARVPENGRNFEGFGEDPLLAARTAVAEISGIQENPVIATVKHFAVNSQETNRYYVSSNVDDRTLHEIYLPPFEAAVRDAHVGAVMCAYGLDIEMPGSLYFGSALSEAVSAGTVSMATIDKMARSILTSMFAHGIFDNPPPPLASIAFTNVSTTADQQLAQRIAEESAVLLKNESDTLPLRAAPGSSSTIALIGAPAGFGDIRQYTAGLGSAFLAWSTPTTPLQAITARAARAGATVVSADGSDPAAAAALARQASVAVVFAYDREQEGQDRPDLTLPDSQDALIEQVAQANPRTIVVLDTGGPVLMPWLDQVPAVVEAWYSGQTDGDAIAAVLFGDVNPSGRLPQTFPPSSSAVPASTVGQWPGSGMGQDAAFTEGIDVGYRWFDAHRVEPLFPFGYGLSYTTFSYSHLHVTRSRSRVTVSFIVRNDGSRRGTEVAQLYVDQPRAAREPPKQLEGYARVFLWPRHSKRVTMTLGPRAFAHWDSAAAKWRVTPGLERILVGASSRDIRLRGFVHF